MAVETAPTTAVGRPRRWTREEYQRLITAGILNEDDHVQLIDGVIYQMAAHDPRHANAIEATSDLLRDVFGAGYRVRAQLPLGIGDSEPEPDVAVVRGH